MKAYIIVENNYEYNDEINYFTGGGYVHKAYKNKEKAEEATLAANIEMFRNNRLGRWSYSPDEIFNVKDSKWDKLVETVFNGNVDSDWWEADVPSDISEEDLLALVSICNLDFYIIEEVDIHG